MKDQPQQERGCCEKCEKEVTLSWGKKVTGCSNQKCPCHTPPPLENYEYRSHSHCWESENPPCGMKGKHLRCCLCTALPPESGSAEVDAFVRDLTQVGVHHSKSEVRRRILALIATECHKHKSVCETCMRETAVADAYKAGILAALEAMPEEEENIVQVSLRHGDKMYELGKKHGKDAARTALEGLLQGDKTKKV